MFSLHTDDVLKAVSPASEEELNQGRTHSAHEHESIVLQYKELIREQVTLLDYGSSKLLGYIRSTPYGLYPISEMTGIIVNYILLGDVRGPLHDIAIWLKRFRPYRRLRTVKKLMESMTLRIHVEFHT